MRRHWDSFISCIIVGVTIPGVSSFQFSKSNSWTTPDVKGTAGVYNNDYFNNMLLRVRSNLGTWKLSIEESSTTTTKDILRDSRFDGWRVVQPFSMDPNGKPLCHEKSLQQQGIQHGTMIFCRLEEKKQGDENEKAPGGEAPMGAATTTSTPGSESSVIDLVDSDKEETPKCSHNESTNSVIELMDDDSEHDNDDACVNLLESSDDEQEAGGTKRARYPKGKQKFSPNPTSPARKPKRLKASNTSAAASSSLTNDDTPESFQIASYNVWFGPPDPTANQVFPKQRMEGIAKTLQNNGSHLPLLFIGFQELTNSLKSYLGPELQSMGYNLCTQPLGGSYGVGLGIPANTKIVESKFKPFQDSTQGRGLLYVQTPTLLFATTHLESFIDAQNYNGAAQREAQIIQATTFCQDRMRKYPSLRMAIIAGDFNWDDERKRGKGPNQPLLSLLKNSSWKDAGKPFDYTYDGKENPMLGSNLRRRFDRCLYLSRDNAETVSLQKLGKTAIPNLTWNKKNPYNGTSRQVQVAPSDHFGIAIRFESKP